MIRTVVIGRGIEGLLASWVFKQHPHLDVWVIGSNTDDDVIDSGRTASFEHTAGLREVLSELRVNYSSFVPRQGILLNGSIKKYPCHLRSLNAVQTQKVWCDWRLKSGMHPKKPNGELKRVRPKRRLRCDPAQVARHALRGLERRVVDTGAWSVGPGAVTFGQKRLPYDFVVLTEPIWRFRSKVWFQMPSVPVPERTSVEIIPRNSQQYRRFDHVLTPYTPHDAIYQLRANGPGYLAEMNGEVTASALLGDLNFLFPEGYDLVRLQTDHDGSISTRLPRVKWPENVAPLGSYAEWKENIGLEAVVNGAYDLMRRWIKGA